MIGDIVVESSPPSYTVNRETLDELLVGLTSPHGYSGRWNVVEVLEVLLEAGQYKVAQEVCESVLDSLGESSLSRLFLAYHAYISYVMKGKVSESLSILERMRDEIGEGAHSPMDRIRVAVLQARLLTTLAVSSADGEVYAARAEEMYESAFRCALDSQLAVQAAAVTVELVKLYACCAVPDGARARAALLRLSQVVDLSTLPESLIFDIKRVSFLCQQEGEDASDTGALPRVHRSDLESEATRLGRIAEGLVALSISRKSNDGESLRVAEEFFRGTPFLAGIFESAYQSGMDAARRGLHIKAKQFFSDAKAVADRSGFLHGKLIAVHALVTCSLRDGDTDGSQRYGEPLKKLLGSEVAKVVIGLPMATHALSRGEPEAALSVVEMCRKTYRKLKMLREEREAFFLQGTILSMMGLWEEAQEKILKSIKNSDKALSVDVVAYRKASLAQTILMNEISKNPSQVSTTVLHEIRTLLEHAAEEVRGSQKRDTRGVPLARVLISLAQIFSLEKRQLEALGALAETREIYARHEMSIDVAVVDALTGVSLLDLARLRGAYAGTQLFDEAVAAFDRAFEVFQQTPYVDTRWKIAYYLAMACHMNAHFKRSQSEQQRWHEMAIAWLLNAEEDYAIANESTKSDGSTSPMSPTLQEGYQFAVGLSPKVLSELKEALGLRKPATKRKKAKRSSGLTRGKRSIGVLH